MKEGLPGEAPQGATMSHGDDEQRVQADTTRKREDFLKSNHTFPGNFL